jgi:hypothetical protein
MTTTTSGRRPTRLEWRDLDAHIDDLPMRLRRRFATRPSLGVRGRVALSVGLSLVASLAATAVARRLRGRRRMQG